MIFFTILAVVVIFSILVLIHEWGHFIMARRAGIKVLEFGIGFPPRLFKKKVGETLYTVNAIPFGGFVKLYGEDSSDPAVLKNKRSFASQTKWVRIKVVAAGVCMNFVLAIALLTLGFSFGIEPLMVTEQDLFAHLDAGNVKTAPGVFVSKVGKEAQAAGLKAGDRILAIDDRSITSQAQLWIFQKGKAEKDVDLTVRLEGEGDRKLHLPLTGQGKDFGINLKPSTDFPRLTVAEIAPGSESAASGLQPGDIILTMNGDEVFYPSHFETVQAESDAITYTFLRGDQVQSTTVRARVPARVVISEVFPDSAAVRAGFLPGDQVLFMDDVPVSTPQEVQKILREKPGTTMSYRILRGGAPLTINAQTGEKNILGIALSSLSSYKNKQISVYRTSVLTSIMEIKKVRYAPQKAFTQAVQESIRLTGITVKAFGRTIGTIISKFSVPEEIGGPVQIAYYTHTFIQEGFFALLRFMALLSLSLAVINVLPIPALDGGRLFFILVEAVSGKRVNARFEAIVHSIGFVLLLILIGMVTYSDIVKLF